VSEAWVHCPLCGFGFPGRASCPAGCPMARACRTVCCPNCRYRFVLPSPTLARLAKLFRRRERP